MSHCRAALLSDRAVLRVSGADAVKFLQGLITNDVAKATGGHAIHAGLLSPQGKVLFDFFVLAASGGFLLDVSQAQAAELAKRLGFYRLRANVDIAEDGSLAVAAAWASRPSLPPGAFSYADPRLVELGTRMFLPGDVDLSELGCEMVSEAAYQIRRITLGVPEGGIDYAYGDTFPHEALFDQLNGVDFSKGCFIGQEVVSRMEHRGTARKRIVPVEGDAELPAPGTDVEAEGMAVGRLGSSQGRRGLALLRLDRAEEARAAGEPLKAGSANLSFHIPSWARFRLPTDKASA